MSTVENWSTSAGGNNAASPDGFKEGQAPSTINDSNREVMASVAIEAQVNRVKVLNTVAGTNTITASMSPNLTAYSAGMIVVMTPAGNNTGATTLNIDSLGALDVQKADGDALVSGDLVSGIPAVLVLDSGADDWILLNPQATFAQLSQINTFTAAEQIFSSSAPVVTINESDGATDNKNWRVIASGEKLIWSATNDAKTVNTEFIGVERTGTTVDSINLQATEVQVNGVEIGFLGIPINSNPDANRTCVLSDAGRMIHPTTSGITLTIPANSSVAYDLGTVITFANGSSGSVSIAITTDTMTLAGTTTTGTRTLARNGIATALKTTATTWLVSGTGLS